MKIEPKIRNGVCLTTHPLGCETEVKKQIDYVKNQDKIDGAKSVLIIGSSTGYGLASRISAAFGCGASTIGVFFEREERKNKPGTPGFYNMKTFDEEAKKAGLYSVSINGDAFSDEIKHKTIKAIKESTKKVDLIIYSLASGVRVDPKDGKTYKSALKPIGKVYKSIAIDSKNKNIIESEILPATKDEIDATRKVMGGEDWQLWINALLKANVLAEGCITTAFSYIGPEITQAIYREGTIGEAKKDLEATAKRINSQLMQNIKGKAYVSVNKAVVTRAAAVIPAISLYICILFKVMKEKEIHEGCIEQMYRLFYGLFNGKLLIDDENRIRMDDLEMSENVQKEVSRLWNQAKESQIDEFCDFDGYYNDFLNIHGFAVTGVDYKKDVDI